MSDKWSDDLHLVPVGTTRPTTVHALLRKLGLHGVEDRGSQIAAVRAWLCDHEPGALMVFSIRRYLPEALPLELPSPDGSDHAR